MLNQRLTNAHHLLAHVSRDLETLIEASRDGTTGYITREWGFMTPGGLGGPIGGKFRPWEAALEKAKTFFPEPDAFSYFNANPTATRLPPESLSERIHEKLAQARGLGARDRR
jgi:hypothetical protein